MSIREKIAATSDTLTPSERKLATALLSDYPYAGLISIQELAERAEVSAPSISRFVTKIGLSGYPDLQRQLVAEMRAGQQSPVDLHATSERIEGGYLSGFLRRAAAQMQSANEAVTEDQFGRICDLLNDRKRSIYAIGGRISDTIALILSFHLRQSREDVFHLPRDPDVWPEYLLRMKRGDVLFVVDFRRYQRNVVKLAEQARARRAKVVLMTDQGLSPATRFASEVISVPIDTGTVWDSYSTALAVTEAMVTRIAEETWGETSARIEAWDATRETILEND